MTDRASVVITVPIYWAHAASGATPVVLGCRPTNPFQIEGEKVGYVSGGKWPAGMQILPPSLPERDGLYADVWVNLDPEALAKLPAIQEAVKRREAVHVG